MARQTLVAIFKMFNIGIVRSLRVSQVEFPFD